MKPDIESVLLQNGLALQPSQSQQLERYVDLLLSWNKKINLISRKDEEFVWKNHILLSLAFACTFEIPGGAHVLDIGTGGGLPGIPLSIVFPNATFLLADSVRKKITAVESMIHALGLSNASAEWTRVEELSTSNYFDSVIARSVSSLKNLTSWSLPLLRTSHPPAPPAQSERNKPLLPSPAIISLKGGDVSAEIAEAQTIHPRALFEVTAVAFPGSEHLPNQDKKFVIVRQKPL